MEAYLSLPADLAREAGLSPSNKAVHLDDFIPRLSEIESHVTSRIIREKIRFVSRFYRDSKFAKNQICQVREQMRDEIVLIYRLRNSIVHEGQFDRRLLQPYAQRAAELARSAIQLLAHKFNEDPTLSAEAIFTDAKVQYDRTIGRLEKNLPVDFMSFSTWGEYPRRAASRDN